MTWAKSLLAAVTCATCVASAWANEATSQSRDGLSPLRAASMETFVAENPGVRFFQEGEQVTRVYGQAFATGVNPEDTADRFIASHAGIFGVTSAELDTRSLVFDGRHTQPVMYDEATGTYKFTLVYYTQRKAGLEVFRSDLRLLVRNEPGFPLVLAASALRDLSTFNIDATVARNPSNGLNQAKASQPKLTNFTQPQPVIWAGVDDMVVAPNVAYRFVGTKAGNATEFPEEWLFITQADNGKILYKEDLIVHTDIVGNVSGMATQGVGSGECDPEEPEAMPFARVVVNGTAFFADESGHFMIPNAGNDPVTVTSTVRGRWFGVTNTGGTSASIDMSVTPPGPVDFLHNEANATEQNRAEVNGYIESNAVRNVAIAANPSYPNLNTPENSPFPVNVNQSQTCNAFYSPGGQSINFYRSGGGCPNTSYSTIIHHEYGHHLVAMAGSGQGAFGEGTGDVMSVLVTDQPLLALGWSINNCNSTLRRADNTCQFASPGCSSCGSEAHDCGNLLSGCVWSTRQELVQTEPLFYLTILRNIAVNAILLHNGTTITAQIPIDYVTLDDDDSTIENGSPHYAEIDAGFGAHGLHAPALSLLAYVYPQGQPQYSDPNTGASVEVEIQSIAGTLDTSSAPMLHVSIDGGVFVDTPLTPAGGISYTGSLPPAPCFAVIRWYISARTTSNMTVTSPAGAPATAFSVLVATDATAVVDHDFETDGGFTVSSTATDGQWDRGVPITNCDRGNPPADFDGSGQCWLTDNSAAGACNSDVDGGATILTSETLDMSTPDMRYVLSYARWYSNTAGGTPMADTFVIEISNDDGATWHTLETVGPTGPQVDGGWNYVSHNVATVIEPTAQMKVRFNASDLGTGSVVEAGVDAFSVDRVMCEAVDATPPVVVHDSGLTTHPFAGYIDPRSESTNGVDVNRGIQNVTIRFTEPVLAIGGGPLSAASFTVGGTGAVHPTVTSIDATANPTVVINLSAPIPVQQWTTIVMNVQDAAGNAIQHLGDLGPGVNEGDRVDIGFLPADVDQSGLVNPLDVLRFRQILNGIFTPPQGTNVDFIDINRDGSISPLDLLAMKQLVNGFGNATRAWAGQTLPPRP